MRSSTAFSPIWDVIVAFLSSFHILHSHTSNLSSWLYQFVPIFCQLTKPVNFRRNPPKRDPCTRFDSTSHLTPSIAVDVDGRLADMPKTYHGTCHCGAVKYEADLDLSSRFTARCNCTFCSKLRYWGIKVKPEHFRLLSPPALEDIALSEYIIHSPKIHNRFCKHCGIYSFIDGWVPEEGEYVYINVACLDLTDEEFKELKVRYVDGRSNTWATLDKEEVSYL